jgi:hypothetical protein
MFGVLFRFVWFFKFAVTGCLGIRVHWNGINAATFAVIQGGEFEIREQLVSHDREPVLEFLGHARVL